MVDEVKLVLCAEKGTEVVEAIPLRNVVGQGAGVRMTLVRMDLDVKVVGEHLLGIACCQEQLEEEEEYTNVLTEKYVTGCFLVSTEGGGVADVGSRPPPSCVARLGG